MKASPAPKAPVAKASVAKAPVAKAPVIKAPVVKAPAAPGVKATITAKTVVTKPAKPAKANDKPEPKFEDELMSVAEQLIIKGKEQGYLTPDDILQGFPEIDAEPDQIFRIFAAFKEIGIE